MIDEERLKVAIYGVKSGYNVFCGEWYTLKEDAQKRVDEMNTKYDLDYVVVRGVLNS